MRNLFRKNRLPQAIREAIDSYPGGLCFSMPDGRPILVNQEMNRLVSQLTGHTVLDARTTYAELQRLDFARLRGPGEEGDGLVLRLPDGGIWRFRQTRLQDGSACYLQLEADDITDLCRIREELVRNNRRLESLHERQVGLLQSLMKTNREKELLSVKMRVHDELGRCLIATKNALRAGEADVPALTKAWEDAILDLQNVPLDAKSASPEAELRQVAAMIGCRVDFTGELPADRGARLLLCAAAREALTNAVRHAGAKVLTVAVSRTAAGWRAEISDNGTAAPASVREGGGLKSLRQRLEQEGASLQVICRGGVRLLVEIPSAEGSGGGTDDEDSAG